MVRGTSLCLALRVASLYGSAALPIRRTRTLRPPHHTHKNRKRPRGAFLFLAEREGFEPSLRHNRKPDFESGAIDHSATSPKPVASGAVGTPPGALFASSLRLTPRCTWGQPAAVRICSRQIRRPPRQASETVAQGCTDRGGPPQWVAHHTGLHGHFQLPTWPHGSYVPKLASAQRNVNGDALPPFATCDAEPFANPQVTG